MSVGPSGEKRPKGPIARAVHVARMATGEIAEALPEKETELARIAIEALTLAEKPKPTTPPPEPTRTAPPPPGPPREVQKDIDPARTITG